MDTELTNLNIVSTQRGKAMIMDTLPDLVPEGVELSSYTLSEGNQLTLTGAATNPSVVQLFVSELANSGLVDAPTPDEPICVKLPIFMISR